MIWTQRVLHKIEWGMLTTKLKQIGRKYPLQLLAAAIGLLLMYSMYVVMSLRFFMQTGEIDPSALYFQFVKMTLLLLSVGIVFSRNKMKRKEYQFFFLNSAIRSMSFVVCVYFFPILFCFIILGLLFLPILLGLIISEVPLSMYWLTVVSVTCCVLSMYTLASWMTIRVGMSRLISKTKEHLLLHTIGFVGLIALLIVLFQKAIEVIPTLPFVYLMFLLLTFCSGWLWLHGLSDSYVNRTFLQLKVEVKQCSYRKIRTDSAFLSHLRQEFAYFCRSAVFKEQGILFLFLVFFTFALQFVFTPTEAGWLYAFIIQFALKEIFIMLPLMIGREYHMNRQAIFMLNASKGAYLLARIFFYYGINLLTYFVYIGLVYLLIGIESEGQGLSSLSILLITVMAACIGFVVNINEFNKVFVILTMIAVFSFIDMLLLEWLSAKIHLLVLAYVFGSLALISCMYAVLLKRPVLR
ncbi:hypothetical protein [Bacillus sp. NPDC093026]|uniref:hypothetical protein n=1 Tax=Bacillus sp. NPDC093026 TaxID=3363948 RepID=UPI0037FA3235